MTQKPYIIIILSMICTASGSISHQTVFTDKIDSIAVRVESS